MKLWKDPRAILGIFVIVLFLLSIVAVRHVLRPRVVVSAKAPNGIEFCIVQKLGEPFNTGGYYRKPGGPWGWFYYDHEDSYWGKGVAHIEASENLIKVYRGKDLTATFNWETETFTLVRNGIKSRRETAAQWLPAGKDPAKE